MKELIKWLSGKNVSLKIYVNDEIINFHLSTLVGRDVLEAKYQIHLSKIIHADIDVTQLYLERMYHELMIKKEQTERNLEHYNKPKRLQ